MKRRSATCGSTAWPKLRSGIVGAAPSCTKKASLCWRVERRLVELRPGLTLKEHEQLLNLVAHGHRRAAIALASARAPTTSDAWIELLCSLHSHLFREALPAHAGRLRLTPVAYGHGHHERPGTDPEHIDLSLRQCFDDLVHPAVVGSVKSVDDFAKWGALFLERFFDIHPFDDGNGRVARLVLAHTAVSTVQHGLRQDLNYRSKKRYRNALEYAFDDLISGMSLGSRWCRPDSEREGQSSRLSRTSHA